MTDRQPLMPLYGFVEGDTMGVVVLARPDDSVRDLAQKLIDATVIRVRPGGEGLVKLGDRILDQSSTLRGEGIGALDRVDLVWR